MYSMFTLYSDKKHHSVLQFDRAEKKVLGIAAGRPLCVLACIVSVFIVVLRLSVQAMHPNLGFYNKTD